MADHRFKKLTVRLTRMVDRRGILLALSAFVGGSTLAATVTRSSQARRGRHHNGKGRRHKERKRLRKQCKKQCNQVQRDCLFVCRNLGNPDEICHPQCSTARHGCRRGC